MPNLRKGNTTFNLSSNKLKNLISLKVDDDKSYWKNLFFPRIQFEKVKAKVKYYVSFNFQAYVAFIILPLERRKPCFYDNIIWGNVQHCNILYMYSYFT